MLLLLLPNKTLKKRSLVFKPNCRWFSVSITQLCVVDLRTELQEKQLQLTYLPNYLGGEIVKHIVILTSEQLNY